MDDVITQVERPTGTGGDYSAAVAAEQQVTPASSSPSNSEKRPRRSSWKSSWKRLCSCCYRRPPSPQVDRSSLEDLQEAIEKSPSPPPPGQYLLEPSTDTSICLVIDLDETLVHSSFKPIPHADFIVPVEIDGQVHQVYVAKRPYVDEFLEKMGELYECVLFTASLAKYADPVADLLDHWGVFKSRLFRESCVFHRGNYVKDLARLGRDLGRVVIVDNSPASYIFHPDNAVPVCSWFDDASDTELLYLIPFFQRLASVPNVYSVLRNSNHPFNRELKAASAAALNSSQASSTAVSSGHGNEEQQQCNNHNQEQSGGS